LYRPAAPGLRPVAMYVHGGGWHGGDKAVGADMVDLPELVRRGYAVASVNYRHAPRYRFPAQIEDVKCAIRFLRAQAAVFNLDSDRMGAWGASAGGHLVALAALTPGDAGLEGDGEPAAQSSRLDAVVLLYAPADLAADDLPPRTFDIIRRVFGDRPADLARGSPVTYVHEAAPPFLLLHGDSDASVPLSQSQRLYERLVRAGVPARLVIVRNAGHVFEPVDGPIAPDRAAITRMIGDFFDRTVRLDVDAD
jgi:acetyl esterase/lipase